MGTSRRDKSERVRRPLHSLRVSAGSHTKKVCDICVLMCDMYTDANNVNFGANCKQNVVVIANFRSG